MRGTPRFSILVTAALLLGGAAASAQTRGPSPGDVFKDCPECPEMVVVPAGSFMMGSPPGEERRFKDEDSPYRVTIPRSFAVGKFEVTFAEWDACTAAGGCGGYRPKDRDWGRGRRSVIYVSWEDAKEYVQWLGGKTGKDYRLLTEAEWEYAARAGAKGRYWWGDRVGAGNANCDGCGSQWDDNRTAPVGSFRPNDFGLHDVHGNDWEWVEDCWHNGYSGAPTDGGGWTTGGECGRRVLRGGSWGNRPWGVRAAFRYGESTDGRYSGNGFRVVIPAPAGIQSLRDAHGWEKPLMPAAAERRSAMAGPGYRDRWIPACAGMTTRELARE